MLKKKKKTPLKLFFGKALKAIGGFCIAASCFVGCSNKNAHTNQNEPNTPIYTHQYNLPTTQDAFDRLLEIYGDIDNMYLREKETHVGPYTKNTLVRLPYKKNETIKVNLKFEAPDFFYDIMDSCLQEYNYVFSIINPNYQFELNTSPSSQELLDPYAVNIGNYNRDNSITGTTSGKCGDKIESLDGLESYENLIEFNRKYLHNYDIFFTTFKHEFMHILGAGDAYENENAPKNTILQKVDDIFALTSYDVAFLDALYRATDNTLNEEQINEFIKNYDNQTNYDLLNLEKKILTNIVNNNVDEIVKTATKGNYSKNNPDLAENLKDFKVNEDFKVFEKQSYGELLHNFYTYEHFYLTFAYPNSRFIIYPSFGEDFYYPYSSDVGYLTYSGGLINLNGIMISSLFTTNNNISYFVNYNDYLLGLDFEGMDYRNKYIKFYDYKDFDLSTFRIFKKTNKDMHEYSTSMQEQYKSNMTDSKKLLTEKSKTTPNKFGSKTTFAELELVK